MAKGSTIGTRVRKNIKHLTQDEWARFINALKVIKGRSRPGGSISIYDEFTALHMGAVELYRTWVRKWQDKNLDPVDLKKPWADPAHDNPGCATAGTIIGIVLTVIIDSCRGIANCSSNSRLRYRRSIPPLLFPSKFSHVTIII